MKQNETKKKKKQWQYIIKLSKFCTIPILLQTFNI